MPPPAGCSLTGCNPFWTPLPLKNLHQNPLVDDRFIYLTSWFRLYQRLSSQVTHPSLALFSFLPSILTRFHPHSPLSHNHLRAVSGFLQAERGFELVFSPLSICCPADTVPCCGSISSVSRSSRVKKDETSPPDCVSVPQSLLPPARKLLFSPPPYVQRPRALFCVVAVQSTP